MGDNPYDDEEPNYNNRPPKEKKHKKKHKKKKHKKKKKHAERDNDQLPDVTRNRGDNSRVDESLHYNEADSMQAALPNINKDLDNHYEGGE